MTWFSKLKESFVKTSNSIKDGIRSIIDPNSKSLDHTKLEFFEELLLKNDMGFDISQQIVAKLRKKSFYSDNVEEEVKAFLVQEIGDILQPITGKIVIDPQIKPYVIMLFGVNGSGKTTTIAKLANKFIKDGHKVSLAASDTFRAAAIEQLQIWSDRIPACSLITGEYGSDPASVAFKAYQEAQKNGSDILLIDTAGRLHNNSNLMAELNKIARVLNKIAPGAPQLSLLILDGTTGQNILQQIENFRKHVPLSGLIFTKLDSTSRGGIIVNVANKFQMPVYALGIGEKNTDLIDFNAEEIAQSIILDK